MGMKEAEREMREGDIIVGFDDSVITGILAKRQ